jgi:hypothetical protein
MLSKNIDEKVGAVADTNLSTLDHSLLSMDFVSQEHGVPRDGSKDSNAGG